MLCDRQAYCCDPMALLLYGGTARPFIYDVFVLTIIAVGQGYKQAGCRFNSFDYSFKTDMLLMILCK